VQKSPTREWICRDQRLVLGERSLIMGVLNVTPDSFSDGGAFFDVNRAVEHAQIMQDQGADVIDVGGESTRPGAEPVALEQELDRVIPVIMALKEWVSIPISVDTYKANVAKQALQAGAHIVNDISGLGFDPDMAGVVASSGAGLIMMHIRGEPRNMQKNPVYDHVVRDLIGFFRERIDYARKAGIDPRQIVIDPGIGFGKTLVHNYTLIRNLQDFKCLGYPILVGPSRKSFIGKALNLPVQERLEGTLAAVTACILNGADIVRVHDVKETMRAAHVADFIAGKRNPADHVNP
jgi:dihydropteroate synthase